MFAEKGCSSLSMREISAALGVSTGTLYHYFESKEDLFEKLMDYMTEENLLSVTAAIPNHGTLQERLEAYFNFNEATEGEWMKMFLVLVDYYRNKKVSGTDADHSLFNEGQERYIAWVGKYLGIEDLELVRFIFIFTEGFITQRHVDGFKADWKKHFTMLKEMILLYVNQTSKS